VSKTQRFVCLCAIAIFATDSLGSQTPQPDEGHDKSFWRQIQENKYAVPDGQKAFPLAQELSSYLGSTDPELRDDLAYSILATWIANAKLFSNEELNALADQWTTNLRSGIGESGTDTVLRRSFSALCLASLAQRDLRFPFLGRERYRSLLEQTLEYLRVERDLRGFDATKGWVHATAHTADLLAELANNPGFEKKDQAEVLRAVTQRLATAGEVFTYGEQDRLANAVAVMTRRTDFDSEGFQSWLSELDRVDQATWKDTPPKLAALLRFENNSYFLRGLVTQISQRPEIPASAEAKRVVLKSLRDR
jgi:hypothetical protein